ncbi:MAG: hypothetical protein WCI97_13215 [Bacteroidota bacterium]
MNPDKTLWWKYSDNKVLNLCGYADSGYYLSIANDGYTINKSNNQISSNYSFLPLYPILIYLLGFIFHSNYLAAIAISNIALFVSCYFLFYFTKNFFDENIAYRSIGLLLLYPTSYLLSGVFSESLFLMFGVLTFYFANKQQWVQSSLSAALMSVTRPFGLVVILPLLIFYLQKNGFKKLSRVLWFSLIPFGILIYIFYCYQTTGDPLIYFHHKKEMWHVTFSSPLATIRWGLLESPGLDFQFTTIFTIIALLISLSFLFKKKTVSLAIWSLLLILIPLTYGNVNVVCMFRYILVAFPLLLFFSIRFSHKLTYIIVSLIFFTLHLFMMWNFALGNPFTA